MAGHTRRDLAGLSAAALVAAAGCSTGSGAADAATRTAAGSTILATPSAVPAAAAAQPVRLPRLRVLGTVATGIAVPWGLAFLPDHSAIVSERDSGTVLHVSATGAKKVIGTIAVHHTNENGLLGLAVSKNFTTDRFVYAYRTTTSGNQVVRLHWPAGGRLGSLRVLLDGIAAYDHHDGGRLAFGPDGYLYVSTGDAYVPARSQDRFSLNGKILRITALGGPAPHNPFDGRTGSRYVWSYGHRNVEGFGWDTRKRMWSCEFGNHAWDELNHILPGRNYGWPLAEGKSSIRGLINPVEEWRTPTASPSGLAVVRDVVYFGALQGQEIWQVDVHTGRAGATRAWFHRKYGRIRTVVAAPDGSLWVTTSNTDGRVTPRSGDDRILRVGLHY